MIKQTIFTAMKGSAMGMAEVIPGVSGGTIAFITGIYERLLNAIKSLSPALITTLKNDGIKGLWKAIDGTFLMTLGIGMLIGIGIALKVVTDLIEQYPVLLWAFFFGLIIASAIYIARQLTRFGALEIVLLILGLAIAVGVTMITPAEISDEFRQSGVFYVVLFFAAAIAICALILPGVSGSFMLLIMGLYVIVIPGLKKLLSEQDLSQLPMVAVFCAGALFGLLTFSRLVSWTFNRYRNPTLATLTGFMIGSLVKIWPWRVPTAGVTEEYVPTTDPKLMDKIIEDSLALPAQWAEKTGESAMLGGAIGCMVVGFLIVFALAFFGEGEKEDA